MTSTIVRKAASLGKIIKMIPGIDDKLSRIDTKLDGMADKVGYVRKDTLQNMASESELQLSLSQDQVEALKDELIELINVNPTQLARIDTIRRAIALSRFRASADNLRQICESDPDKVHAGTIKHNLWELKKDKFMVVERPSRLLFPLLSIDRVYLNRANLKVLIIGPRTEMENIQYVSYGFKPENVRSVDLFSYSDTIDVGDMHELPYSDNEFDIVVCGWVISYSDENKVAAKEMLRVCKPGGLIAISLDYKSHIRYTENGKQVEKEVESTAELLEIFEPSVSKVFFKNDPDPDFPVSQVREPSGTVVVFERS